MNWPTFDIAHGGVTYSIPYSRISLTEASIDGDRSESNFLDSANHDHYGSGDGPNNNGTSRGQYTGPGH